MIRDLKALGLALLAVCAMSAVVASAAPASSGTLTTTGSVTATAEQVGEHVFTLTSHPVSGGFATVKCKKAHFEGVGFLSTGATSATVAPSYSECNAFGLPATITTTGCNYRLDIGTLTELTVHFPGGVVTGGWHVTKNVVCASGFLIRIVAQTCEVVVGSQNGLTTSTVENGPAWHLTLKNNISKIKYTVVKDGIGCPLAKTGAFEDGHYVGTSTVAGLNVFDEPIPVSIH